MGILKYLLVGLFLNSSFAFADYSSLKLSTFEDVVDFTQEEIKEHGSKDLLVVFDIDRTLLEITDCLDPNRKFSNGFFKFEAKVRECNGFLTSILVPSLIDELKAQNIAVMALTARRSNILKGTLSQLEDRLLIEERSDEKVSITFETSPLYSNRKKTIKFDQQGKKKVLKKELVIKRGVAMASGANKGLALQAFLRKAAKDENLTFKRIIFVDDDSRNIKNLENAFANTKDFISILHYTEHSK